MKGNKLGHRQNISIRWGHLGASSRCYLEQLSTSCPECKTKAQRIGPSFGHQRGQGCQVCLETLGSPEVALTAFSFSLFLSLAWVILSVPPFSRSWVWLREAGEDWEIEAKSGQMCALRSPGPASRGSRSLCLCMLLHPLEHLSADMWENQCLQGIRKAIKLPLPEPGDTWYWFSVWKWFAGLLKPGKDQMLWASWSHLPSLLSANTRGGNLEIIDQRSFFGVLTGRTKYRRIISLGEKGF